MANNVQKMKRNELISELKRNGLPTAGKNDELKSRLRKFYEDNASGTTNDENQSIESSDESFDEDEIEEEIRMLKQQLEQKKKKGNRSGHAKQNVTNGHGTHDGETRNSERGENGDGDNSGNGHVHTEHTSVDKRGSGERGNDERRFERAAHAYRNKYSNAHDENAEDAYDDLSSMLRTMRGGDMMKAQPPVSNAFGAFSFNDIDNALHKFTGNGNYRVENWLDEFEDYATMFNWNELQKLIYAKRAITDTAKMFLRSVKTLTYADLKRELLNEFGRKMTSGDAHKMLHTTKKKNDESLRDYTLKMREIGVSNGIEDESVIQYIIDGIDDENCNKIMLYGAKSFDELKVKLADYEKYKSKNTKKRDKKKRKSVQQRRKAPNALGAQNSGTKLVITCAKNQTVRKKMRRKKTRPTARK